MASKLRSKNNPNTPLHINKHFPSKAFMLWHMLLKESEQHYSHVPRLTCTPRCSQKSKAHLHLPCITHIISPKHRSTVACSINVAVTLYMGLNKLETTTHLHQPTIWPSLEMPPTTFQETYSLTSISGQCLNPFLGKYAKEN